MTAKEKAKDIFVRILECIPDYLIKDNKEASIVSKNIAIRVIEEILQTNPTIKGTSEDLLTQIVQTKAYYTRVLIELENL